MKKNQHRDHRFLKFLQLIQPMFLVNIIAIGSYFLFPNLLFVRFCATVFLLFSGYFLICGIILWFKIETLTGSIHPEQGECFFPLEESRLFLHCNQKILLLPGFFFILEGELYQQEEKLKRIKLPLEPLLSENRYFSGYYRFYRHGFFQFKRCRLICCDLFGIIKVKIPLLSQINITVSPHMIKRNISIVSHHSGGELPIQVKQMRNSEDFFDLRKYFPGDDLRRLNWNLFAHIGELYLRDTEKIPPKSGKLSILFAPHSNDFIEYEFISSVFYAAVYELLEKGFRLEIYFPTQKEAILIDSLADLIEKRTSSSFEFHFYHSYLPYHSEINPSDFQWCFCSMEQYLKFPVSQQKDWEVVDFFIGFADGGEEKKRWKSLFFLTFNSDSLLIELFQHQRRIRRKKELERQYLARNHLYPNLKTEVAII